MNEAIITADQIQEKVNTLKGMLDEMNAIAYQLACNNCEVKITNMNSCVTVETSFKNKIVWLWKRKPQYQSYPHLRLSVIKDFG